MERAVPTRGQCPDSPHAPRFAGFGLGCPPHVPSSTTPTFGNRHGSLRSGHECQRTTGGSDRWLADVSVVVGERCVRRDGGRKSGRRTGESPLRGELPVIGNTLQHLPLKLLFVHERFGALAGAEANLHLTAAELQRRGHSIALLHGPGTGKGEAVWEETFCRRFAISPGLSSASTAEAVGAFEPDAIYVHKMSDLEVIEALLGSAVPLVRMVHDHDLCCMRSYKYHYFSRNICARAASPYCLFPCGAFIARSHEGGFPFKWVSYFAKKKEIQLNRRFRKIVVNSRYMRDELLRNGFADEKIALHVPVPRNGSAAWRSSFSDRNLVLFAGQIVRGKGVDVLLQSLARMRVRFECVILGDGNHRSFCEELSRRLGLSKRVHFKGYVPPAEQEGYYRECSVVAVSSVWPEPLGMVGIEAMRCGLPVVAFDAGGIKEWLIDGENGFLVPWMDRAQYAARLEQLLRDKTRARRMGERGRERAAQHYDFDRYIDGLEDLFAGVTARPECEVAA